jgi:hypothetical protein
MKFAVLKSKIKLKLFASILSSVILTSVSAVALSQPIDEGNQKAQGERRGPPPFEQLDLDGDGVVIFEEFVMHRLPHGDHELVFKHIDVNGDSVISAEEFASHKPPKRRDPQKH